MKRIVLTALVLAALVGCASASHIMVGQARPAIAPELVKVYRLAPKRYEEIAQLDATSAVGFGTQGQTDAAIERLKREAAKLGANGVILQGVGTVGSPVSMGVGGERYSGNSAVGVGFGIPTAQRSAAGIAIHVIEE